MSPMFITKNSHIFLYFYVKYDMKMYFKKKKKKWCTYTTNNSLFANFGSNSVNSFLSNVSRK